MITDLQKASLWKRISAALFDGVMVFLLALGLALALSSILGYENYSNTIADIYSEYEEQYDVDFGVSPEKIDEFTDGEKENFEAAKAALEQDKDAAYAYNMLITLTVLIATLALLFSFLVVEFAIPLLLGNGQTLGKKVFGIALMRVEGIKVTALPLFIRAVLGKFTIEIMVPIYVFVLLFMRQMGIIGIAILVMLVIAQIVCLVMTRVGALLHDVFAGTVAVDMASQRIFENKEELLEYTRKIHAEKAAAADY